MSIDKKIEEISLEGERLRIVMQELENHVLEVCHGLGIVPKISREVHGDCPALLVRAESGNMLLLWRKPDDPDYFTGFQGTRIGRHELPEIIKKLNE